jgi:4-amino-4-deoxy-L-arabinose transferase-like glycosyltransferase
VGVLQIAVSAVTLLLVYGLVLELFGRKPAVVAAALFAFYPTLVAHTPLLWSDSIALCPIAASLLLLVRAQRSGSHWTSLGAGLALGVGALTREFLFWFIPIGAVWLALAAGFSRRRAMAAALVCIGAMLAILPWSAFNARVHGDWFLISTNTWRPLYIATLGPTRNHFDYQRYTSLGPVEQNRFAREQVFNLLSQQPGWLVSKLRRERPVR